MKTKYIFLYCLLFICNAVTAQKVITGAEQMDRLLPILKGKRVALVVNQTSKVGETHLLDTLLAAHIQIKKVFAPEHGFRGDADAGETIRNGKDTRTGIPILSLYGKNKKPTATQLQDIDLIVFDIQDVGARFYTYISTMQYVPRTGNNWSSQTGPILVITWTALCDRKTRKVLWVCTPSPFYTVAL